MGALDGPGLRCVVFFQGCPMRCRYCQNPDTWDASAGREMTCEQVLAKIERCRPYFGKFGGVTLSGGEPFMQAAFAAELLQACRQRGIHTAVDTCGYFLNEQVDRGLDSTSLVILDIKHADGPKHKELTGCELDRPLAFLRHVAERGIPLWVRQVIVPGWNDTPADVDALAVLVKDVTCLQKVELLAYHTMARAKWDAMGILYPLGDTPPVSAETMKSLREHLATVLPLWGGGP